MRAHVRAPRIHRAEPGPAPPRPGPGGDLVCAANTASGVIKYLGTDSAVATPTVFIDVSQVAELNVESFANGVSTTAPPVAVPFPFRAAARAHVQHTI